MRVAIVGAGSIGSVVAAHLLEAAHEVTLVARGNRFRELVREGLRVRARGRATRVHRPPIAPRLTSLVPADLLIVAVQTQQVDALLPDLLRHPARTVVFLLNAHRVPPAWGALGERLVLGFPAMLAGPREGVIDYYALPSSLRLLMNTTFGPAPGQDGARAREVLSLFRAVKLASVYERDMSSWLGTHSALVTALLSAVCAHGVLSWRQAHDVARALRESLEVVRAARVRIKPASLVPLRHLPPSLTALGLLAITRSALFQRAAQDYVQHGRDELRAMYRDLRASAHELAIETPYLDRVCAPLLAPQAGGRNAGTEQRERP